MEGVCEIENTTNTPSQDIFSDLGEGKTDTICQFYMEGKCRFGEDCFNIHPHGVPQKLKQKSSPIRINFNDENEKKCRMKTAQDVINRIKWDSDLDAVIHFKTIKNTFEKFRTTKSSLVLLFFKLIKQFKVTLQKFGGTFR